MSYRMTRDHPPHEEIPPPRPPDHDHPRDPLEVTRHLRSANASTKKGRRLPHEIASIPNLQPQSMASSRSTLPQLPSFRQYFHSQTTKPGRPGQYSLRRYNPITVATPEVANARPIAPTRAPVRPASIGYQHQDMKVNSINSTTPAIPKRRERWTEAEHERFLQGLEKFGRKWKKIQTLVKTKTAIQVRTHAYGYFAKLLRNMPEHVRILETTERENPSIDSLDSSQRNIKQQHESRRGMEILQKHVLVKRSPADEKRKADVRRTYQPMHYGSDVMSSSSASSYQHERDREGSKEESPHIVPVSSILEPHHEPTQAYLSKFS